MNLKFEGTLLPHPKEPKWTRRYFGDWLYSSFSIARRQPGLDEAAGVIAQATLEAQPVPGDEPPVLRLSAGNEYRNEPFCRWPPRVADLGSKAKP